MELETITLRQLNTLRAQEIALTERNFEVQKKEYEDTLRDLRRELDNEKKDRMIVMNQMLKSMETEKNTRIRAYNYLIKDEGDAGKFEARMRDRLAQNADDVEFYKAKLLEKINMEEKEANARVNMRNFNKRIKFTDQGIEVYGVPRMIDHIYDLVAKLRSGNLPNSSPKRLAALEDIAVYLAHKPVTFLRHFGFVNAITFDMKSLDHKSLAMSLYILSKIAQDEIFALEMCDDRVIHILKEFLEAQEELVRLMALQCFSQLCCVDKDAVKMIMMLQDYSMRNNRTGTHCLWRIIFHMCHVPSLRIKLIGLGTFRLLSLALDSASSQHYIHQILRTIKLLVDTQAIQVGPDAPPHTTLVGKLGPKLVDNFLDLLATSRDDNLLLIIELLGYTGLEDSEGVHVPQAKKIIQRILEIGISATNTIKFAILSVVEKMFNQRTSVIANRMNSERILLLIMAGLNHGSSNIKETASKLTLRMVVTENIDLSNEPDLLSMVLLNCKLHEDEFFELRRISIEIIFRMSVSVSYAKLIILNASQVLEMTKIALSILHPEISNGANQNTFLLFDSVRLDDAKDEEVVQVKDEEAMHYLGKLQGFRDRVIQEMSQNRDNAPPPAEATNPAEDKKDPAKKPKRGTDKKKTVVVKKIADDSDDSEFEEEKANINTGLVLGEEDLRVVTIIKNLVKFYDGINERNPMRKIDPKGCDIYASTYFLIKIATILLSCDITYLKVMSLSLHAVCGIIMDKAIGAREMIVVDSIITFYSTLFDIICFRMDFTVPGPLENLIQIISARFVIKILKIIKKELDSHVTNEVILSSTISLIIRLLMREETALILTKFRNLGPVLEKIIEKGLEWKSPNILMMASILGTHLSIYPEFQEYLFNREFIAYLMGLLEPSNSEYIQAWGADGQNKSDSVMAGESLLLTESIMANTEIIIQLTSLMLNNLCHQSQLSKILGSLPVKYGVKPLVQIFLIDKTKVSKLIQCLCLDTDFQSKMISFVPVDFAVTQKARDEASKAETGGKGPGGFYAENKLKEKEKKDKKKEEEQKNAYEAIKELIHDPKTMKVVKGREYHVKIARIVFNSNKPNSLLWRRLVKMSIVALKDDSQNSILWMGRLLKPLSVKIQHDNVVFEDIQQIDFDPAKREDFYYKPADLDPKIYPEDSMSATMKKYKMYPSPKKLPQLPPDDLSTARKKRMDYEVDDEIDRATDLLHPVRPASTLAEAFATPAVEDQKKAISIKAKDELRQQGLPAKR